jgi:DNA primase
VNLSAERRRALTAKAQGLTANITQAQPYLDSRGISPQVAEMFALGYVPHGGTNGGRLSIPYITPSGVVDIKYRCTDLTHHEHKGIECPKYTHEIAAGLHLFNAQALIRAADLVVITEGELDAICVQAYCNVPAVAYPGVSSWSAEKHYPLCFEGVAEVVVIADGDKVGREAAARVARDIGLRARVVDLPSGEDANSFVVGKGAGALLDRIMQ